MRNNMNQINRIAIVIPPKTSGTWVRIAGTGATEAHNATGAAVGKQYRFAVGGAAVRALWSGTASLTSQVAATAPILAASSVLDWEVESDTRHVYVQAAGTGAYEAWIWPASP